MEETPEIQPNPVRIEPVELLKPTLKAPDMTLKPVVLPRSVIDAVEMHHQRMKEAELNRLQKMYADGKLTEEEIRLLVEANIIQETKSFFQIFKENSMKTLWAMLLSFLQNNWRTTVAGLAVVASQTLAKTGISLSQHEIDALMGIGYAIIFKFSAVRWDLATIVGVVLMTLSFFVSPILGGLGITLDVGILTFIQMTIQQAVATLLKDQKQIFILAEPEAAQ